MIQTLNKFSKKDILRAGGKGANLGELIMAGIPVPPGFVIMGKSTDKEIIKAYRELGSGPVAVRSSAKFEDSPNAAFAGQFDTYLNVICEEDLLQAVSDVQDSFSTERVISYCKKQGIDHKKNKLAVIVQKMVEAEYAGILFTANPVTGSRKEVLIDASPGLGEAVVSGLVTPDHYVMRKGLFGWKIIESTEGKRELMIESKKGGGTKTSKSTNKSKLKKKNIVKLARFGKEIEAHFKTPQDIEWATIGDKIFILQSRPITALSQNLPKQNRVSRAMNALVSGIFPARPLPLSASTLGPELIFKKMMSPFLNLLGMKMLPFDEIFEKEDGILLSFSGKPIMRPSFLIILAPFKLIKHILLYKASSWKQDPITTETISSIKSLEQESVMNKSPKELIAHIKKATELFNSIIEIRLKYFPRVAFANALLYLTLFLTSRRNSYLELVFANLSTKVTETNMQLELLAERIRQNKVLKDIFQKNETNKISSQLKKTKEGQEFLSTFDEFLEEYGYRESRGTFNISNPTWKESPELVLGILKGQSSSPPKKKPKNKTHKKIFFKSILKEAQHLQGLREDTRFLMMTLVPTIRGAALTFGKHLVRSKILKDPQDIFYFQLSELEQTAKAFPLNKKKKKELKDLFQKRKAKFLELEKIPFIDPRLYGGLRKKGKAFLMGSAGSPGETVGPARVIKDISEFKSLRQGEVLIAPYTNPSWTPLFEVASAVVVDTGGVMSHAAIVAREYGIPAVMGTIDGTKKIKTGERIRVNGTSGEVFKLG